MVFIIQRGGGQMSGRRIKSDTLASLQDICVDYGYVLLQSVCEDDEFELDNQIFSLDYRSIDGDVALPQNSFKTPEFTPHGKLILKFYCCQ